MLIMRYFILGCSLVGSFCHFANSQPVLTDVAGQVGISHSAIMVSNENGYQGGAAWFDFDNDGWYDLYLTGGRAPDALYRNNGDGTFTDVTNEAGIGLLQDTVTQGVTTGDLNRDGFDDILVTTEVSGRNILMFNNGNGSFTIHPDWDNDVQPANSFGCLFVDLNMDGWLDMYIANWSPTFDFIFQGGILSREPDFNHYYENNGDGTFVERAVELGIADSAGCAFGLLYTDFDNDADLDLFVANDFGYFQGNSPNRLFRNDGPNTPLSDVAPLVALDEGMSSMGVAKADLNFDGYFDYYVANIFNDKMFVRSGNWYYDQLVPRGLKNDSVWLQDLSEKDWQVSWAPAFLDIDNDGDEDLFVANGSLEYNYPLPALDSNKLFLNSGFGYFDDLSYEIGIADTYTSRCVAYCDYDLDGDLDVFVGITDTVGGNRRSFLYRNDSPAQNWFQIQAQGVQNNLNGIGARVVVYSGGTAQMREIGGETSFNSQHWHVAHFGLGSLSIIDSMNVIWPGGSAEWMYDIDVNQMVSVQEDLGIVTEISNDDAENLTKVYPNPVETWLNIEGSGTADVTVYDILGAIVILETHVDLPSMFDLSELSAGKYSLKIGFETGRVVMKPFVKR